MKQGNLISIIVPAYNAAPYLERCLDSILAQETVELEIVLIDDGSTDGTGLIADRYSAQNPDIIKVLHLENGGVTRARLKGVESASGEWIGFVDADDEIEPDMYKRLLQNAIGHAVQISHCGYQTIVNGGERVHYFYNTGKKVAQDHLTGIRDLLSGEFVEPGLCNKLFHNTLFHSLLHSHFTDFDIRINEDLLMNYYLFNAAQMSYYEDFCPYHYLTRPASVTRSGFETYKALDPVRVRKMILDDIPAELKDLAWSGYINACAGACLALTGRPDCSNDRKCLITVIKQHKDKWKLLGKKGKIRLLGAVYVPHVYSSAYRLYERCFQQKIYE